MRGYLVSPEANSDIFEIWRWIAKDSVTLADRVEAELYDIFEALARMPGQGHERKDLTRRPVLFFPLFSYLIVYQPDVDPIRITALPREDFPYQCYVGKGPNWGTASRRGHSIMRSRHSSDVRQRRRLGVSPRVATLLRGQRPQWGTVSRHGNSIVRP